jgi:hypothetical protein
MQLKPGVRLGRMQPHVVLIIVAVNDIFWSLGLECVITSIDDSVHSANSLHYKGLAIDFRTHYAQLNGKEQELCNSVKHALGPEFDVVLEGLGTPNEHLHVEYDPKEG